MGENHAFRIAGGAGGEADEGRVQGLETFHRESRCGISRKSDTGFSQIQREPETGVVRRHHAIKGGGGNEGITFAFREFVGDGDEARSRIQNRESNGDIRRTVRENHPDPGDAASVETSEFQQPGSNLVYGGEKRIKGEATVPGTDRDEVAMGVLPDFPDDVHVDLE